MTRYQKALGAATVLGVLLTGGTAFAQTASTTTTTGASTTVSTPTTTSTSSTVTTPTAPNTGAGGDTALNLGALAASALVLMGGAAYLARKRSLA